MAAINALKEKGMNVHFHRLDVDDNVSIEKFGEFIINTYEGIDVLVNNAGIMCAFTVPMHVQAEVTIKINYFGTKLTCEVLFQLLNLGARVVNISSSLGVLLQVNGDEPDAGTLR